MSCGIYALAKIHWPTMVVGSRWFTRARSLVFGGPPRGNSRRRTTIAVRREAVSLCIVVAAAPAAANTIVPSRPIVSRCRRLHFLFLTRPRRPFTLVIPVSCIPWVSRLAIHKIHDDNNNNNNYIITSGELDRCYLFSCVFNIIEKKPYESIWKSG